ncbi:hypothetical protein OTU49_005993 [Cherax quadricarinatus]|uniref:Uncharacterized protein n=1 Tax=Cherax quadricarinatus TaxID=27406 RepID=A0AAW0WT65_CHEQU|nr:uncharacterized protein LOC128694763 [Cherax quadricarinatus]
MTTTLTVMTVRMWTLALVLTVAGLSRCLAYSDQTIRRYTNERTCWWNEICKEEFQMEFRCKCPRWSFCRSPGKYYNAYCSVMASGYIWKQPRLPRVVFKYSRK